MTAVLAPVIRSFAFVRKEVVEVARQPRLVLALVVGPFLIMLLFGLGYRADMPPLRALFVGDPDSELAGELATAVDDMGGGDLEYGGLTEDGDRARAELGAGAVDVVVVLPDDPVATVRGGERAVFEVVHDRLDPFEQATISLLARTTIDRVNRQLLVEAVAEAQRRSGAVVDLAEVHAVAGDVQEVDAEVLVSPFTVDTSVAGATDVGLTDFYAPAVIALLLQHLAITFAALSLVRERALGTTELFAVAPLRAGEALLGKYVGFGLVAGVVAAVLSAAMLTLLDVPMAGSVGSYAAVLALTVAASLGIGFVISTVVTSDLQAANVAMIVLLLSIFFSGFFIDLLRLAPAVRVVSWMLPTTWAIDGLRAVMFSGAEVPDRTWVALGAGSVGLLALAWALVARRFRTV